MKRGSSHRSYRAGALLVSLLAHATVLVVAHQMPHRPLRPTAPEWVDIEVWDPPPEPVQTPEPEPEEALEPEPIPEPEPEKAPEPEPEPEPTPEPPPKAAPKPPPKAPPKATPRPKSAPAPQPRPSVAQPLKLDMTLGQGGNSGVAVATGPGGSRPSQGGGRGRVRKTTPTQKRVQKHVASCNGPSRKLRPKRTPNLNYPMRARAQGLQGRLEARLFVDTRGRVTKVQIRRSPGPVFDRELLPKLRTWTFDPAMRCGKAIAAHYDVVRHFRLNG